MSDIKYGRKRSGIKRELKKKVDEWLESITDEMCAKPPKWQLIVAVKGLDPEKMNSSYIGAIIDKIFD